MRLSVQGQKAHQPLRWASLFVMGLATISMFSILLHYRIFKKRHHHFLMRLFWAFAWPGAVAALSCMVFSLSFLAANSEGVPGRLIQATAIAHTKLAAYKGEELQRQAVILSQKALNEKDLDMAFIYATWAIEGAKSDGLAPSGSVYLARAKAPVSSGSPREVGKKF